MKILYYNWIQFDNVGNKGGGVTVYQKNIIDKLMDDNEIYFISSGRDYRGDLADTFIEKTTNVFGDKCKSYVIVNSPILATGDYLNQADLRTYLNDMELYELLRCFIEEQGGFDVIHFNNFEGLSLNVFKLKEDYPETKFVYSLHNYYMFCTQVNLWKDGKENCLGYDNGKNCANCHLRGVHSDKIKKKIGLNYEKSNAKSDIEITRIQELLKRTDAQYDGIEVDESSEEFVMFRSKNVEYLNEYVDIILAVSERTGKIAIDMGVDAYKVQTSYIGTKFADRQIGHGKNTYKDGQLFTMVYMGYMRREKGFYFFLEACEKMSDDLASKCRVVFASRFTDEAAVERMAKLRGKFGDIVVYDGYTHDNIDEILSDVHLGVVPVLWEDNLPQVAIEMVSLGIPIMTSNLGGAQELCVLPEFVFEAGNIGNFIDKLEGIVKNSSLLEAFWKNGVKLTTMDEHIKQLCEVYRN